MYRKLTNKVNGSRRRFKRRSGRNPVVVRTPVGTDTQVIRLSRTEPSQLVSGSFGIKANLNFNNILAGTRWEYLAGQFSKGRITSWDVTVSILNASTSTTGNFAIWLDRDTEGSNVNPSYQGIRSYPGSTSGRSWRMLKRSWVAIEPDDWNFVNWNAIACGTLYVGGVGFPAVGETVSIQLDFRFNLQAYGVTTAGPQRSIADSYSHLLSNYDIELAEPCSDNFTLLNISDK